MPRPRSLRELLDLNDHALGQCDLFRMNLLCAQGLPGTDNLDIDRCEFVVEKWARSINQVTKRHLYRATDPRYAKHYHSSEGYYRMEMMTQVLQEDFGVRYNPARINEPDFKNPSDLFVHGMIENDNGGTCASIPVLLVAVGRKLGYPLKLVSTKGHVFCRWDGNRERFNFEGTPNGGCAMHDDEYYTRGLFELTQKELSWGIYLQSKTPRQELASFMGLRGHCLQDHGRLSDAMEAYRLAHTLHPENPEYKFFGREIAGLQQSAPAQGRDLY